MIDEILERLMKLQPYDLKMGCDDGDGHTCDVPVELRDGEHIRASDVREIIEFIQANRQPDQPTLRDQFAMAALQGLFAADILMEEVGMAESAYNIADAMLAQRAKEAGK